MKNATIRLILILALLSAVGIITTQVFWIRRAYDLEEKELNLKINNALRTVAFQISQLHGTEAQSYNIVDRISPNYYLVQTGDQTSSDMLAHLLQKEFEKVNLITDFQFGVYDCTQNKIATTHYIHMSGSNESFAPIDSLPYFQNGNYYFGVYFPHRNVFLSQKLSYWGYSSLVLLCILIFLGYVVFVILKQKRLSEVQKDFVSNMTHEFKTPLASIQLAAEGLTNPGIINKPQRLLNYSMIIDTEAKHLTQQVERVLQMAYANKAKLHLHRQKVLLQEVIKDVSEKFKTHFEKKNAILNLNLPDEPIYLVGDKLHLKNMISNLLDNALKYSKENLRVNVTLCKTSDHILLAVEDNGIGIAPENLKLLFKRFFRVPTGDLHDVKGFGLGLNYVRIIARAHDGEVACKSELGKGSTFFLTFKNKN